MTYKLPTQKIVGILQGITAVAPSVRIIDSVRCFEKVVSYSNIP